MVIPEIEILRDGVENGRFTITDAALGIGVSWPTVQHWIQEKAKPHRIFRRAMRAWLVEIGAGDGLPKAK